MKKPVFNAAQIQKSIRPSLLLVSAVTLAAAFLFLLKGFPFHRGFCVVTGISALIHFTAFLFFDRVVARPAVLECLVLANIVMLGFLVHFTGGLMSPFVFFYFGILSSSLIYGVPDRFGTPLAVVTYAGLIISEAYGIIAPWGGSSAAVYASKPLTLVIVAVVLVFILLARYITGLVVMNLRSSLEREMAEKEGLLKKFTELNSTAQIGVLAHRIAHDLRGPIGSISGYLQLEEAREKTAAEREALKDILGIVADMAESLAGITRFGKVQPEDGEKIQLTEFLRTLLAIVSFSPQARGVQFVKGYDENLPVYVAASRPDLQQAYFNIVKNAVEAVRHNADGKRIEIGIRQLARDIEVSVSDNGPGIPKELLRQIFKKSITTKKDGTGIGLVITRDLLLRNYGDIELRNREGGGLSVITRLSAA